MNYDIIIYHPKLTVLHCKKIKYDLAAEGKVVGGKFLSLEALILVIIF